ncbi:hypothetical protein [Pelagibacterium lentulum]|uniref:Uncharacterized protein n=1 Tax=Pelagibacterium lentulum TaxID=2029865 RepID=A0A916W3Q6_9HYPH|nr:hypothetical protein [Pelagibacterium lentulum]GGA63925.1 hypothetical protein GCM10011499_37910 [Pelagibacterium lentulum]
MRNLDDVRLSLAAGASGGVVDLGLVKSVVGRAAGDQGFADLMTRLGEALPTPGAELDTFVTRFSERCVLAGIDPSALADAMLVTGAMLKTMTEGRKEAAAALRATAEGIEAHGA